MIRSIKEQNEIMDICLGERLDIIVPQVLNNAKADMWIVASKEYHEDLVFGALTPASYLTARRITMLVFLKKDGETIDEAKKRITEEQKQLEEQNKMRAEETLKKSKEINDKYGSN
mgnify:CR=1 FL=1